MLFGGGRKHFTPHFASDPEYSSELGGRRDGRDLVDEWLSVHRRKGRTAKYVWTRKELQQLPDKVDHVLGRYMFGVSYSSARVTHITWDSKSQIYLGSCLKWDTKLVNH